MPLLPGQAGKMPRRTLRRRHVATPSRLPGKKFWNPEIFQPVLINRSRKAINQFAKKRLMEPALPACFYAAANKFWR